MSSDIRIYGIDNAITFKKTKEKYGGLSNMASGYPINLNNIRILTSEALYQSLRYPEYPEFQKEIILQRSPMTAKMISKKYLKMTRHDWDTSRISIMRWCLKIKLMQNWDKFGMLLLSTQDKRIVELSTKDKFWGAILNEEQGKIVGTNALGRLLMELREEIPDLVGDKIILPPKIENFYFLGNPIEGMRFKNMNHPNSNNREDGNIYLF